MREWNKYLGKVSMKQQTRDVDFGVFEKEALSEKITARIISLIKEKMLTPGDQLPPERELAEIMQVSRPSLREALRALSTMGVIENRQGSGNYIASLEPNRLIEHIHFILSLDDNTLFDLLQARKILEVGLIEIAAQKITPEQLQKIEAEIKKSELEVNDPESFLFCDLEIHKLIAEIANIRILSIFMGSIQQLSIYSRKRTSELLQTRFQTVTDHRLIYDALACHDPVAARHAMQKHIQNIEMGLLMLNK